MVAQPTAAQHSTPTPASAACGRGTGPLSPADSG